MTISIETIQDLIAWVGPLEEKDMTFEILWVLFVHKCKVERLNENNRNT